jgi:hypothetical protein
LTWQAIRIVDDFLPDCWLTGDVREFSCVPDLRWENREA